MKLSRVIILAAPAIAAAAAVSMTAMPASAQATTSVSRHTSVSTVVQRTARGPAQPRESWATVSPRVNCGGFNGHVGWDYQGIEVYGQLWESCGGTAYLYVSYKDPFGENVQIANVANHGTTGLDWQSGQTGTAPGYISVTVCSNHGGWHCGTPVQV